MTTKTEYAWAAGFMDGEGTYLTIITDRCRRDRGYINPCRERRIMISAVQTNRQPLERLQALFGGSIREERFKGQRLGHKPIFRWTIQSFEKCQFAIVAMWQWMSLPKREQSLGALVKYRDWKIGYARG